MFADPVVGERFFDRVAILDLLRRRATSLTSGYRQNIALIGPELIGKTSIIKQFLHDPAGEDIIYIYIELRDETFSEFAGRVAGTILYKCLKALSLRPKETLQELLKQASRSMPKTAELIQGALRLAGEGKEEEGFSRLLDLFSCVKDETRRCCVIIFDEFHNLEHLGLENPFYILGNKIMVQRDIMYIIASSNVNLARRIIDEKLSLLFGNFETLEIEPFSYDAAYNFLSSRLAAGEQDKIYLWYLASLANGHPFYLDIISQRLNEKASAASGAESYISLISSCLADLLFNAQGLLHQYFSNSINRIKGERNFNTYFWILTQVANGRNKASNIDPEPGRPAKDLTRYLNRWVELDILGKNGVFYRFNDSLLKFWVRNVYAKRARVLYDDSSSACDEFISSVNSDMAEFVGESRKDASLRLKELFKMFSGEIAEIDDKRMQFPRFTNLEVKPKEGPLVLARDGKRYWAFHIGESQLTENEVLEFARRCAVANGRYQKKILIALDEVDLNAKLLAKEKGFLIWTAPALNDLLDIFGKQKIIPQMR